MLILVLVFGMTVVGCGDGSSGGGGGGGGKFTLTGIPSEYNGRYALLLAAEGNTVYYGCNNVDLTSLTYTLPRISNGSVSLPMWYFPQGASSVKAYSGNVTMAVTISFYTSEKVEINNLQPMWVWGFGFDSVKFSNGSAQKAYNEAN